MSRSSRAWAKGCELVGAAARGVRRLGKLEARESLEAERLVRTAFFARDPDLGGDGSDADAGFEPGACAGQVRQPE